MLPATALGTTIALSDWGGTGQFGLAFLVAAGTTELLKQTTNRERPDSSNNKSFPSGHTSITFTAASFIHLRYGLKYAVPFYAAAGFTGYSRVHAQKHFVGDVLAGAAIGVLSAWLIVDPLEPVDVNVTSDVTGRAYLAVRMSVGFF